MRSFLLPLLVVCALAAPFTSAQSSQPPTGSSLPAKAKKGAKAAEATAPKPDEPKHDYSQEAFVVEQYKSLYHFEKDGTGRKETTARIRVQSEAGVQQWGQIQVGYNSANEKVEMDYVRVIKADGSIVKAGDDAVQDLSAPLEQQAPVYTDYRVKHITVPGLRPGETLEYHVVTVIHTALAPGEFWADYEFDKTNIDLDEEVDVDVPSDRPLTLKNKPGMDPKISEDHGRRLYHWTSSHLEREDDQKDKDKDKNNKDKKKKKKNPEDEHPDIQLTTFASWEQIGRWYAGLEKDRRAPSPEVRAKAEELTKGLTNDLDRVEALYDFVALNFRYVSLSLGLGRYQPHSSADVLHNQYGDCKDKHTLLASLLEAEGFHASSVLINSSRKLDPDVPSPSQFDHVITMLPMTSPNEEVWMDTTSEVAPFRLLAYSIRHKQALVIPAGGTPHLEETPADTPVPDSEISEVDGKINNIGKLEARVHYTFRGDEELLLRSIFRRVPESQWQRVVENVNSGMGGDVTNLKVSDPAKTREAFTMTYDVSRPNFLDWSKKKSNLSLPLCQFNLPDLSNTDEEDADSDSQTLKLGPKAEYTYKIKLELPAKYTAHAPLPFSLKRDYADYQATYKLEGATFTAGRTLTLRQDEIPVPRVEDYEAFRRAVGSDLSQFLAVENTVAGSPTPPADMKADDLVESGRAAMNSGNLAMGVQLLKRATEVDPKNKYAWNMLAAGYIGLRQNDDAIAALKKQIEINPYDEYAYNALGHAYQQERKYEDAATAFNKQIEINPLDKNAHAGLGAMYSEWKKYDLAVPELEKAASLTPDNAELQVSLGDAYLNLGQDDKALATFDHAVELSATPLVWNNIAYQLSLKKTHLDRAQQYAESAVSATAASLRNVSLDRLTQQELGLVSSLIAYWDTLGWVYYGEGNLDKAERYVSAAWGAGRDGEVGDHLGQIYEKRGRRDEALCTYALSLNARRPPPDARGHLASLAGGEGGTDAAEARYKDEFKKLDTFQVARGAHAGSADFALLMKPGIGSSLAANSVRLVSGDGTLQSLGDEIRSINFGHTLPDDTPTTIPRRGTLTCPTSGSTCEFVLVPPDDARAAD